MKRHRKYLHLVACEVYEDRFGSLVVLADKHGLWSISSKSGYIQSESEIDYFWEQCLGKTTRSLKGTKEMISRGYHQEVWIDEEYLEAIIGFTCEQ
jgi:hypothetical protein